MATGQEAQATASLQTLARLDFASLRSMHSIELPKKQE